MKVRVLQQVRKLTLYLRAGNLAWSAIGLAMLAGLYWLGAHRQYYLLFHMLAETFSIVVGFGIFVIAWNVRRQIDSAFLSTLAMSLLAVSGMDLLHALTASNTRVRQIARHLVEDIAGHNRMVQIELSMGND